MTAEQPDELELATTAAHWPPLADGNRPTTSTQGDCRT